MSSEFGPELSMSSRAPSDGAASAKEVPESGVGSTAAAERGKCATVRAEDRAIGGRLRREEETGTDGRTNEWMDGWMDEWMIEERFGGCALAAVRG